MSCSSSSDTEWAAAGQEGTDTLSSQRKEHLVQRLQAGSSSSNAEWAAAGTDGEGRRLELAPLSKATLQQLQNGS